MQAPESKIHTGTCLWELALSEIDNSETQKLRACSRDQIQNLDRQTSRESKKYPASVESELEYSPLCIQMNHTEDPLLQVEEKCSSSKIVPMKISETNRAEADGRSYFTRQHESLALLLNKCFGFANEGEILSISPLISEYVGWMTFEDKSNVLTLYPPYKEIYWPRTVYFVFFGDYGVLRNGLGDLSTSNELGDLSTIFGMWHISVNAHYFYDMKYMPTAYYTPMDVFFACFAVNDLESFQSIKTNCRQIRQYTRNTLCVLVGTKSYLRERGKAIVSIQQAEELAHELGALNYFECSSRTHMGVKELCYSVILSGIEPGKKEPAKKIIVENVEERTCCSCIAF